MRAQISEQLEAKNIMKAWLLKHRHKLLTDIAHETAIPLTSLYSWINGRSLNFRTPAYIHAVEQWVARHESEVA